MNPPAIEVRGLWFAYPDGTEALKDLSFRIEPGSAVALVGANGAGKSTVLLQLVGSLTPGRGEIRMGDVPLTRETASRLRRAVGMVFQNPDDQLFMPTVAEDVAFGPLNARLPPGEVEQRVASALERVDMTHVRERPPYRLSGGEKRAVAIATVLALEPEVLVMDEPSSYLDPRSRRRLIELLQSFHHTRIIATHDLEMVVEVCDRVIVLDGGRIVADGPTCDILNDAELMRAHGLERPHILSHRHPH
jgi:cobalt/nickel transport system ATP-binding protein